MTSILLELSMFPTDKGESKSKYVSKLIEHIKDNDYKYVLTPMSTIVEFDNIDEALKLIKNCYDILEKMGCNRVYSIIKFDIRKNHSNRIKTKISSIEKKIGKVKRGME